jgi:adenosylcobinamide-phosphate synthase
MLTGLGTAAGGGWLADQLLGEPPDRWHPVVAFGRAMTAVESLTYRPSRAAGALHLAIGVGGAVGAGLALQRVIGRRAATVMATTVSVAGRMLAREATVTLELLEAGDLDGARTRARSLVGRDRDQLDEPAIVRATIESVAENTIDAVVAPLWWAALAGAPGVLAHRAINTLDAMVGHRCERYEAFGWASARADDIVNYLPARAGAAVVAILRPRRAGAIWQAVRDDAPAHPSPNGGVIEAAVAAAVGTTLGGTNRYAGRVEDRGLLGDGPDPNIAVGRRAICLTTTVGALTAAILAGLDRRQRR